MRTFSHFLLTAIGQEQLKKQDIQVHAPAALLGSVLPDLPLFLLISSYTIYYRWIDPIPEAERMRMIHEELYFTDPLWIISHNLFHSPLLISLLLILGYWGMRMAWKWGKVLFWYTAGSGFHTLVDIFTHYDDGPLLLFPLDWKTRFSSPVSYWDPDHYGIPFTIVEYAIDLAILFYFLMKWMRRRHQAHNAVPQQKE